MHDQLRVFVASSSEQIEVAERIAEMISVSGKLDVHVWSKDVFDFSAAYIESLEKELDLAEFAVVVFTGDDAGRVRRERVNLPRDNVIFELGLFIGRLGRERCFFFVDTNSVTHIASDLSGVKPVEFSEGKSAKGSGVPDLKVQAENVKKRVLELGARYKPSQDTREQQAQLWNFSIRVGGYWWERMRKGEDDMSALSYVHVYSDAITNTPRLEGQSYNADGEPLAEWKSVVSGVVLGRKPTIYYRWEGEHDEVLGQRYGGGGRIVFDDQELKTARGYFYDTNYALLNNNAETRIKRFGLYRCTLDDVEKMERSWSREAHVLIKEKLEYLNGR